MSTRAEILNGASFEGYEDFCAEVVNAIITHYRISNPCMNMVARQPGEILSDPDDDKLYHVGGTSGYPCDEILQASRSCDVIPDFQGVDFYDVCDGDYATIRAVAEAGLGHRLTIGLDETARTMVICDLGDVDVDFGLGVQGQPSLYVFDADHDAYVALNNSADDKPQVIFHDGTDTSVIRHVQEPGLGGRLTFGLDETARTMVICDAGDVDTDFGLGPAANPALIILAEGGSGNRTRFNSNQIYHFHGQFNIDIWPGPLMFRNYGAALTSGHMFNFQTVLSDGLTDADAEQAYVFIEPEITQTGTAGYIGLLMDVTETSLGDASAGAGYNALMDLRVAGTTQFGIQNDGKIMTNQVNICSGAVPGVLNGALPIYDGDGNLMGYTPIYSSIC